MPKINSQGGVDAIEPGEKPELNRAKKADLVTLPRRLLGTNCGNCRFVKVIGKEEGITFGNCLHPKVAQIVSERMCCAFWDATGVKRAWKK
jgi:hypothetical protein